MRKGGYYSLVDGGVNFLLIRVIYTYRHPTDDPVTMATVAVSNILVYLWRYDFTILSMLTLESVWFKSKLLFENVNALVQSFQLDNRHSWGNVNHISKCINVSNVFGIWTYKYWELLPLEQSQWSTIAFASYQRVMVSDLCLVLKQTSNVVDEFLHHYSYQLIQVHSSNVQIYGAQETDLIL